MTAPGKSPDVLIVGGGAIGLALADELAGRGHAVSVFDRGAAGAEASWAAAGLLSPQSEARFPGPFFDLAIESLRRYDAWVGDVETRSGQAAGFRRTGLLRSAFEASQETALRDFLWQRERGLSLETWDAAEVARRLGPDVCPGARAGLFFPDEAVVDPRKLTRALGRAARDRGVEVREDTPVRALRIANGRCLGVDIAGESLDAGCVVDAAGAWAGRVGGLPFSVPVEPVRGQIVELDLGRNTPRTVLHSEEVYIVPHADGRSLVGSTIERVGFEKAVTADAVGRLLEAAARLWPPAAQARFVTAWSGLRPATPDGAPVLGESGVEGLFFATGHYRNGILLTPITSRLMADRLTGHAVPELAPFSPSRFASARADNPGKRPPAEVFG